VSPQNAATRRLSDTQITAEELLDTIESTDRP